MYTSLISYKHLLPNQNNDTETITMKRIQLIKSLVVTSQLIQYNNCIILLHSKIFDKQYSQNNSYKQT